jgi:tripartite-type tricarboxylate transporter receptor subunit TctC
VLRACSIGLLCLVVLTLFSCQTSSGPYPSREIKLIVQASPGGLSDAVSRIIASQLEPALGKPVVCENKPGASGALAFSFVSRRAPDGYTLGHGPVELVIVRKLGYADVGPDNLELLCLVSRTKPVLVVRADAEWQDFQQFAEALKAKPGHFVAGNSGTGSIWHLNALLMEEALGLQLVHLPFPGSSAAITNLLGGHIDLAVVGVGEAVAQVEAGSLRALAVFDQERSEVLPEAPSLGELDYDFGASAWSGFYGPKGLPQEAKDTLVPAFRKAYESERFQKLCRERGMEPLFLDPEDFSRFAGEQSAFFAESIPRLMGVEQWARKEK